MSHSHLTVFSEGGMPEPQLFLTSEDLVKQSFIFVKNGFFVFFSDYLSIYVRDYVCDLRTCHM